ncbi:hypothetical protein DPMN_030038 [Dreissena polymorpha]|uniref:Uncharacterized protein n=1 Tax=Dreissena polymorpha TaxID=45954 RepID=A0A9D4LXH0_DREPO|nr:hypothetical protein DPMN_030038 [Dreissena polymorpha]
MKLTILKNQEMLLKGIPDHLLMLSMTRRVFESGGRSIKVLKVKLEKTAKTISMQSLRRNSSVRQGKVRKLYKPLFCNPCDG